MWSYRPEWANTIEEKESVLKGGVSTVYRFNLMSHTGTYIETTQHKLAVDFLLKDFDIEHFYRSVKLVVVIPDENGIVLLSDFLESCKTSNIQFVKGDSLIIATNYGVNHRKENYLEASPSFEESLTNYLCELELSFIGTDTPIIENLKNPHKPVIKLFESNKRMLLIAPLLIDTNEIKTGTYTISCAPLNIEGTSGALCRPLLIQN